MKILFILLFHLALSFSYSSADAYEIPYQPPNPCESGCTSKMSSILEKFNRARAPVLTPSFFSGECYHLSIDYDPEHTHYAASLIDHNELNNMRPYLATVFSFFYDRDEAADWDLDRARREMSPEWKLENRELTVKEDTARSIIWSQGQPAWVYWLRQNQETNTIYMITYWAGTYMKSFCELSFR